jgi:FecR protein
MKRLIFPIAVLLVSLLALAQSYPQGQEDPADAAQHGVARLSLANGSVNVIRGDSGDGFGGTVNEPLETNDRVSTGDGSRAEVQFDSVNIIRLGANTDIRMGDIQYRRYLVEINQGATLFRMLRDSDAQIEISTPSISIAPLRQGIYRVTVRPDGSSEITVRAGEADLISRSGTERLSAGQTVFLRGSANDSEIMSAGAPPYDEWDRWNADRDRFFERVPDVSRYAGPDIDGAQELANYGRWAWDPSYGYVWVPGNVGPDWAPYRDGRWDYLDYYGWSWISYDPWGWAPYHYGNWYRGSFGWAWYPGAIGPRHYWRPAMVGFFGFGSPGFGASLGFGYGNVGWVPLAPYERYRPWYGRGYSGGRYGTVVNNTNIVNVYHNARFNGAVTGLRAADFGRTGVGRNSFVRPDSGDLSRAGIVNGGIPLAPARNLGSGNSGRFANNQGRFSNNPNNSGRFSNNYAGRSSGSPGASAGPLNPSPTSAGSFPNRGGWRRLDSQPGAPPVGGNRSDVRIIPLPREPQPVRISPPIVNNRNEAPANFRAPTGYPGNGDGRNSFGGFGGPRPNAPPQQTMPVRQAVPAPREDGGFYRAPQGGSRGGGGNNGFEAPRGYSGGREFRSAPPSGGGGAARGNSGGGGQSHGGGQGHGEGRSH